MDIDYHVYKAAEEEKDILKNLMQFYFYDFSEYVKSDVEETGLFGEYTHLDDYWTDKNNRFPYFVKINGKYAGFVLVRLIQSEEKSVFSIAEFFIMKKYRHSGLGRNVAHTMFDLHKGKWEVFQIERNIPAQHFWRKVIAEYTKGLFTERVEQGRIIQVFVS
ncbi:GNAT family N-acetyltransferase [Desmospora profundinema]|uniref:Acetyltransferase n=1 Tax=Desmospora profundinema TaxID=1571184 RepID=A0ABU1INU9_9BACL|nr:GNAT family N-acetyltransferase [Desmospora profundinema]MDR6225445.1 putative acetyltransferase [Desmospora profundinema]